MARVKIPEHFNVTDDLVTAHRWAAQAAAKYRTPFLAIITHRIDGKDGVRLYTIIPGTREDWTCPIEKLSRWSRVWAARRRGLRLSEADGSTVESGVR